MTTDVIKTSPFDLTKQPTKVELLGKYFQALADSTRLEILRLIHQQERSVGEIVKSLGMSQPRVSGHLACLRWCGFVTTRREGTTIFYSIADVRVERILEFAEELLEANKDHIAVCKELGKGD